MNLHRSILLATSLSLAACASSSVNHSTSDASVPSAQFTVHVVEASGGAWGASAQARAAMESLKSVDHMMMSGTRATLVLKSGVELTETEVREALEENGLKFETLDEHQVDRPSAAYVAKTPKFTWAATAQKVRAALMTDLPGVQDVFCGTQTIIHMKSGSAALAPEAIEEALVAFEIEVDSVERDDSAVL